LQVRFHIRMSCHRLGDVDVASTSGLGRAVWNLSQAKLR